MINLTTTILLLCGMAIAISAETGNFLELYSKNYRQDINAIHIT